MADDPTAIGERYSRIAPRVAALLAARLRVPAEVAKDLVQDVFAIILASAELRETFGALEDPAAVRYVFVACVRRHFRGRRRQFEFQPDSVTENLAVDTRTEAARVHAETEEIVIREIAALDQPYRDVLQKLLIDEKAAPEISLELGRPVNTIYQQIHRGLHRLRARLRLALNRAPYARN